MISLTKRYPYNPTFLKAVRSIYKVPDQVYGGMMSRDPLTFKFWLDRTNADRSFSPFNSSVFMMCI